MNRARERRERGKKKLLQKRGPGLLRFFYDFTFATHHHARGSVSCRCQRQNQKRRTPIAEVFFFSTRDICFEKKKEKEAGELICFCCFSLACQKKNLVCAFPRGLAERGTGGVIGRDKKGTHRERGRGEKRRKEVEEGRKSETAVVPPSGFFFSLSRLAPPLPPPPLHFHHHRPHFFQTAAAGTGTAPGA